MDQWGGVAVAMGGYGAMGYGVVGRVWGMGSGNGCLAAVLAVWLQYWLYCCSIGCLAAVLAVLAYLTAVLAYLTAVLAYLTVI